MKIKCQIKQFAAVLAIIIGVSIAAYAQRPPMAGGYRTFAADSEEALQAGTFAVEANNEKAGASMEFGKVLKAERQVVAGTNFRLCIEATDTSETKQFLVVVYRNLKNEFSLTTWKETECAPKEEEN